MILFEFSPALPQDLIIPLPSGITGWIEDCVSSYGKKINMVDINFITDEEMLDINQKVFGRDYLTDTISISYKDNKNSISGTIYISLPRVQENARIFHNNYKEELLRVIIHSILHLLGFDDQTDEERKEMRAMEDACLRKIL